MSLLLFETHSCTSSKIKKTGDPTEYSDAGQGSVSVLTIIPFLTRTLLISR
jgi:hypothetical protein